MPDRIRLFVALELPGEARAALAAFRDRADPSVWRPVRDEALHLTLAFLGHRPHEDVALVTHVLDGLARAGPVPLVLGPGLLLPPRRARVLCAEVDDVSGALGSLQARVSAGLAEAGVYEPERRPFRAHATVARLRSGARSPRALDDEGPERVEFLGGPLTLFRSQLRRGGAVYEPLVQVALPAAGAPGSSPADTPPAIPDPSPADTPPATPGSSPADTPPATPGSSPADTPPPS